MAEVDGLPAPEGWEAPEGYMLELRDPPARCRGCDAEVAWATTPRGNRMPLNRDGVSHFATCPQAAQFRGRRGSR